MFCCSRACQINGLECFDFLSVRRSRDIEQVLGPMGSLAQSLPKTGGKSQNIFSVLPAVDPMFCCSRACQINGLECFDFLSVCRQQVFMGSRTFLKDRSLRSGHVSRGAAPPPVHRQLLDPLDRQSSCRRIGSKDFTDSRLKALDR